MSLLPQSNHMNNEAQGFSSSLCTFSGSRSDCCALACCGLLLADRNTYLLSGELPTPWWQRLSVNIGIPLTTLLLFGYIVTNTSPDMREMWYLTGIAVFATVVLLLLGRGWYYRYQQRCQVLQERMNTDDYEEYIKRHRCETLLATSICGCVLVTTTDTFDDDDDDDMAQRRQRDLCTCLWNTVAALCCGALCRCWCQCCGMCAIAQQDRELRRIHHPQRMDYITFEPFDHYAGNLHVTRDGRSVWNHIASMSQLSHNLLHMLGWSLVVLTMAAVLRVDNFSLPHLLVVMATLFQALLILHFVHWRWNRFDLSLDAVIKYFSCGFVLCTGIAVCLELLLSVILGILCNILVLILVLLASDTTTELPNSADSAREFAKEFQHDHLWLFCIFTFLNAFVVAALIEEVTKYFGFWMVEHPDFELETRSKQSRGAGITVAMVATALGFACCENLLYVFVYTPPSIANQVATLVARSIFPVHPLAAALQSIGVCRRDLEGDCSYQLGRIILPALLLHGSFDFVLMLMALLQSVDENDDSQPAQDIRKELPSLISSVMIVLVGLIYYICQAEAQRLRLYELDQGSLQSGEGTLLLA